MNHYGQCTYKEELWIHQHEDTDELPRVPNGMLKCAEIDENDDVILTKYIVHRLEIN